MDILNQIISDITKNKKDIWIGFNEDKALNSALATGRKPLVPSLVDFENMNPSHEMFLIAEIKQASPSQGIIVENFAPKKIAEVYIESNIDAISVLTEENYFKGSCEHLAQVRECTAHIPLLRKDFIVHPYQVHEGYIAGADMVLLIVAALEDTMLAFLHEYILSYGMTPLVEVHNEEELERALKISPKLLGINNRDLKTFTIDLNTTLRLTQLIPKEQLNTMAIISESGIFNALDVKIIRDSGVKGILVGQSILENENPALLIEELTLKGQ